MLYQSWIAWILLLKLVLFNCGHVIKTAAPNNDWIPIPTASGGFIWMHRLAVESQQRFSWNLGESDIKFIFSSRANHSGEIFTLRDVQDVRKPLFDSDRPTRIITHGWLNDGESPLNVKLRETYLAGWDFNVIVVDWSVCANQWNYVRAALCVKTVGTTVGQMLNKLQLDKGLRLKDVYLIGHSLGAHVAGIAGRHVGSGNISTIFALDPALPLFILLDNKRIMESDAQYVEIIHTNGGYLGFLDPIGRADFYPNGGARQPGCVWFPASCAHGRSWELFAETLTEPEKYLQAQQINSLGEIWKLSRSAPRYAKMGGEPSNVVLPVSGLFYINTNDRSPYFEPSISPRDLEIV